MLRFTSTDQPVNNNNIIAYNNSQFNNNNNNNNIYKTKRYYNLNNLSKMNNLYQNSQLKRKRTQPKYSNNQSNNNNPNRPTFQFKIGMQVGVALGDCFLQLQKLKIQWIN